MMTKTSASPVAIRTVLNMCDAIESIIYIENKESFAAYGTVGQNGKVEELLLLHGTAVSSLEQT